MDKETAFDLLIKIIKPIKLNDVQQIVFYGCWEKKTYEQIGKKNGYTSDYTRVIGAKLWRLLESHLNEKVTKKNLQRILQNYQKNLIDEKRSKENIIEEVELTNLEVPEGVVPLDSKFYIKRPLIEEQCYREILNSGGFLVLKGALKLGKSSLKNRVIQQAKTQKYATVNIDFEQADKSILTSIKSFLRWFCAIVAQQLKLKPNLDEYWDEDYGNKLSCTIYFESYILETIKTPLVLALDQVHLLFQYSDIRENFLPLLRIWYEEGRDKQVWQKLRIILIYSTEMYMPLNINQSPFNVGLRLELSEFNQEQIKELASRYELKNEQELCFVDKLRELVGGNPYLLRLGMYHFKKDHISAEEVIKNAPTLSGVYKRNLYFHWQNLQKNNDLIEAMKKIVKQNQKVILEPLISYQLANMGLIKLDGNFANPSCKLYRQFFYTQLIDNQE